MFLQSSTTCSEELISRALEISTTTIRGFQKYPNSLFLVSTHLHQLKEMDEIKNHLVATWYIDCQLKGDTPMFTYELRQGWNDLRLGRILFEREGLDNMLRFQISALLSLPYLGTRI